MDTKEMVNKASELLEKHGDMVVVAQKLMKQENLSVTDLAVTLNTTMKQSGTAARLPQKRSVARLAAAAQEDDTVTDATYLASLLVASIPGVTPLDVANALKDPRNYPSLTAYQLGTVLKAPNVFPDITQQQMQDTLTQVTCSGSPCYTSADVQAAINQLYPAPPVEPTYRREGPAGRQGQMPFDGTDAANGQTITQLIVRNGNIVDNLQVFYGNPPQATSSHGGTGGGSTTITIPAGDVLTGVSGYTGTWFGGNYVLQLTFTTRNGQTYGPYGNMQYSSGQTAFNFTVGADEQIVAFFGSATYGNNGKSVFLGSLGVTIRKN